MLRVWSCLDSLSVSLSDLESICYRSVTDLLVQFLLKESDLIAPNKFSKCNLCMVNVYTEKSHQNDLKPQFLY